MKQLFIDFLYLDENIYNYWLKLEPSYLKLRRSDLFDIDDDIFDQIEFIIGKRNF